MAISGREDVEEVGFRLFLYLLSRFNRQTMAAVITRTREPFAFE